MQQHTPSPLLAGENATYYVPMATGVINVPAGSPYRVTGRPDATVVGLWDAITLSNADGSQQVFSPQSTSPATTYALMINPKLCERQIPLI